MARGGFRPGAGRPKGAAGAKSKPAKKKKTRGIPQDIEKEAVSENMAPLDYMLKVMNDPKEKDNARKDRMAIAAAPFCHQRAEKGGKKIVQAGQAAEVTRGKFAPGAPPKIVGSIGRK